MNYTVALRDLIQDASEGAINKAAFAAIVTELDRIAAMSKAHEASIDGLGGNITRLDAEAGLDSGKSINTLPINDAGGVDRAIRWLTGPWLLNSDGDSTGLAVIKPPVITTNQNNYAPLGVDTCIGMELTSSQAVTLTGIRIAKVQRRLLFLENQGAFNISIAQNNGGSSEPNRFGFGDPGEVLAIPSRRVVWLYYDPWDQRWRLFALPGVGAANIPTSLAKTAAWNLISHSTPTAVASVNFTGLSAYNEIFVYCYLVTLGAAAWRQLRVSTDDGATFLTTLGDYKSVDNAGNDPAANLTAINMHDTASAAARTGYCIISNFNQTSPKFVFGHPQSGNSLTLIETANALNAIQIKSSDGSNLTGGDIYVFGR